MLAVITFAVSVLMTIVIAVTFTMSMLIRISVAFTLAITIFRLKAISIAALYVVMVSISVLYPVSISDGIGEGRHHVERCGNSHHQGHHHSHKGFVLGLQPSFTSFFSRIPQGMKRDLDGSRNVRFKK